MKTIPLIKGKVALVVDDDYPHLSKFRWYSEKHGNTFYAVRTTSPDVDMKRHIVRMHREILNFPKGMEIDHINGDGLDNRRVNIRVVSRRVNMQNWHPPKTSKFPGIYWNKKCKKWRAKIELKGKRYDLGLFIREQEAAQAYKNACEWINGDGLIKPGPEQGIEA